MVDTAEVPHIPDRIAAATERFSLVPLSVVSRCSKMRLYDRQQAITRVPVVVKLPVNDRFGQAPRREETSIAVRLVSRAAHGGLAPVLPPPL
jgi:hypothetical protein